MNFIILTAFLVYLTSTECNGIVHSTPIGHFRGIESKIRDTRVRTFYGIRYGVLPSKDLRFTEAIPHVTNMQNVIEATRLPVSCPQGKLKILGDSPAIKQWLVTTNTDEDCLFLNIWQPVKHDTEAKKPVIVFIHGGGFIMGSSTLDIYNGTLLAQTSDAVVVSFQYRLGALGFLYTGDDFAPGNAGLKDQVLALKWVHRNIEHFGGDKDKITLIGFSAGSASVGYHLLSPETSKLFKRAVLLSGTPNAEWAYISPSEARQRTFSFAARLGADPSNYTDVKKYLSRHHTREFMTAQESFSDASEGFLPTMEPSLVPEDPIRMLRKASHLNGKEVIVSWTTDDGSFLLLFSLMGINKINNPMEDLTIKKEEFKEILKKLSKTDDNQTLELVNVYNTSESKTYVRGLIRAYTDRIFSCPSNQFIAELRRHNATVFQLEFKHRIEKSLWPHWIGVMHGYDIFMLFGSPISSPANFVDKDFRMSDKYMHRIECFVKTGTPNYPGHESWYKDQPFVMSTELTSPDNRTAACMKLKQIMPDYLSGSSHTRCGLLTVLLVFIAFKMFL